MQNLNILPFYLVRRAGLSFEEIYNPFSTKLEAKFKELIFEEEKCKSIASILNDFIFEYVSNLKDDQARRTLLNLKRDIFNNRNIIKYVPLIEDLQQPKLSEYFALYLNCHNTRTSLLNNLNSLYDTSLAEFRKSLPEKFKNESFRRSVMLSSFALYSNLKSYLKNDYNKDARIIHVEQGLLRYYVRMATKASPYAWFTSVSLNFFNDGSKKTKLRDKGYVKMNVNILSFILTVLQRDLFFQKDCPININSSASLSEGNYSFMQNFGNKTIIHEIEKNELVDHIIKTLKKRRKYNISLLLESILAEFDFEDDIDSLRNYISELQKNEFIIYDLPISLNSPSWGTDLKLFLQKYEFKCDLVAETINLLDGFDSLLNSFSLSSCDQREELLKSNFKSLVLFAEKWSGEQKYSELYEDNFDYYRTYTFLDHGFKIEVLLFEDVKSNTNANLTKDFAKEIALNLNILLTSLRSHSGKPHSANSLDAILGEEFQYRVTPVVPFFKKYWDKNSDQTEIKSVSSSQGDTVNLKDFIVEIPNIDSLKTQINIDIKETLIADESYSKISSYNSFAQVFYDKIDRKHKAVINQVTPGFGKMFSRFLYMYPKSAINTLREHNNSLINEHQILVDNIEGVYFNASCHPKILNNEVTQPNYQNFISKSDGIRLSEFNVVKDGDRICIKNGKGKECFFIDLGFQIISLHSSFFNFLDQFSLTNSLENHSPVVKAINGRFSGEIKILPRIILNNVLVLQRKTWIVDSTSFPDIKNYSKDTDLFIFLNKWRTNLGIPNEVFVRISYNREDNVKNNDHKPFYVDFFNPIFITTLRKALVKNFDKIRLTEMLPSKENMMEVNGRKYASENLLQWSTND